VKWVFLLSLLVLGGVGGVMLVTVAYRWTTSMQADVKVVPGEMALVPPAGTVPRAGGELVVLRETYEARRSPVAPTAESVARGQKLFAIYCTPCHGAAGKGDGTVTPRFIPPPDLTSAPVQGKTDGHIAYYIGYGGAIMPAYGEALTVAERWDVVNYVRTLAQK
jgi:S-disulfanyl-L-cysteine oxidoreductase SoxD